MRQLSGMDVSFLNLETSNVFSHVSSMTIYDPTGTDAGASVETTKRLILERIADLTPFRRRLVEVPLGLDLPYWIEDPEFDIDYHVRHHAVPPPGTPQQLGDVVARIQGRPLDRSKPLWELYVIEGVDNGRLIAQLTKIHHAAIDGASGAQMLATLLDVTPTPPPPTTPAPWTPETVPTDAEMLQRTMVEYMRRPEKMIRLSVRTIRELAATTGNGGLHAIADIIAQPLPGPLGEVLRKRLRGGERQEDAPPALPPTMAPRTPWNMTIGRHRRFAYTSMPLADAKEIRRAVGCTFNDVVMALCSGTLRRYLLAHDCLPDEPLIAMVPVSVRTGEEEDLYSNRVSAMFADLATNEPDPARRLARVQAAMVGAKAQFKAIPADALQDFTQFAPPAIAARAMRMASRLRIADRTAPPFNVVISNVPGPSHPLYSAGAELKHFYPVSTLADGLGLNMTVQSYNGNLDFGFVADRDLVPDLWFMIDLLHESMDELMTLVTPAPTAAPAKRPAAKRPATKRPTKAAPAKRPAKPKRSPTRARRK